MQSQKGSAYRLATVIHLAAIGILRFLSVADRFQVSGYDYTTSSHFSGGDSGNLDYYDYETSKHVQQKMNGNNFDVYDYHSVKHFSGTVNSGSVSLYDYETAQHFNYNV